MKVYSRILLILLDYDRNFSIYSLTSDHDLLFSDTGSTFSPKNGKSKKTRPMRACWVLNTVCTNSFHLADCSTLLAHDMNAE